MNSNLTDKYGRRMRKLRVSLLDACNLRCYYCMPKNPIFTPVQTWLNPEQFESICKALVEFGIEQIRITGGEPTIRKDFQDIVSRLSTLEIKKLGMTTNAVLLQSHLDFLKYTRCQHINISLDSLCEETFSQITRSKHHRTVLKSILLAKENNFDVKINTVLIRGVNDHEVEGFLQFSKKYDIEVRFLEMMKIGQALNEQSSNFISAAEVIERISKHHNLIVETRDFDSTSFNFSTADGIKIGFIASESRPFCNSCSRLRLSHQGVLRSCLMSPYGVSLLDAAPEEYKSIIADVISNKPNHRLFSITENMNQIGG